MLHADLPREQGEPRSEHQVREVRFARAQKMDEVNHLLLSARANAEPDTHLFAAVEALASIVEDMVERSFL